MQTIDYRRGLPAMAACFLIWGFQPLYWYMCTNVCGEIDTFFLMACRIIWAAVTCLCILKVQGKLPQLWAVFKDKQVLKRELPASVFLFGDWIVYLWAVQNGRVLECSLGYYIQPLVVFALGAVIFKEKMSWRHFIIIGIVVVGIVLSASGFGGVPYVTIALALMFAVYAAIKKSLTIDSIVSTTSEILMMVPVALLFILFFRMGDNGMGGMTVIKQLLMIGGGIITGLPMVFYSIGVRNLPLMTTGICQYLSPTLGIVCGAIMGEALTREKLDSLRECDAIFLDELEKAGLSEQIWQSFAVWTGVRTVGCMGDGRSYTGCVALRAVVSDDAMTVEAAEIPYAVLKKTTSRIINEVRGVNRVVYDITGKPPGTIEWE